MAALCQASSLKLATDASVDQGPTTSGIAMCLRDWQYTAHQVCKRCSVALNLYHRTSCYIL